MNKRTLHGLFFGLAASLVTLPAFADITGSWLSEKNDEGKQISVEIYNCGDQICGKITDVHNSDNTSIIGKEMIEGMNKKSDTKYGGGKIYAPDTEKWYKSKIKVEDANTLKVSGCVGFICRNQIWTRAGTCLLYTSPSPRDS